MKNEMTIGFQNDNHLHKTNDTNWFNMLSKLKVIYLLPLYKYYPEYLSKIVFSFYQLFQQLWSHISDKKVYTFCSVYSFFFHIPNLSHLIL